MMGYFIWRLSSSLMFSDSLNVAYMRFRTWEHVQNSIILYYKLISRISMGKCTTTSVFYFGSVLFC